VDFYTYLGWGPNCAARLTTRNTSLVERAEERVDRFVDYKDKRISDAERAHT
jgi:hypothetical protein